MGGDTHRAGKLPPTLPPRPCVTERKIRVFHSSEEAYVLQRLIGSCSETVITDTDTHVKAALYTEQLSAALVYLDNRSPVNDIMFTQQKRQVNT